ncbi:sigma-54-dependent transcriptional regulator [Flavihumibacter petaseus]|uniref:Putative two-component response regulator n=1 Tax=Flavihumibacter petaseus NBRC 106054 TaxID=1220578 RepID=A0A0E9MTC7_9BACT|nr:sigma-54 dependent transcriptional regulator [Flavihumibacter petaseus]GAO41012.1 putative two-component response regulator [Flavihumibacter petaseus NBRC 106054]
MPGTILLIDDETQLRKLLTRIISLENFTVIEAGSLKEADAAMARHTIDVVLCDVKLPDGNGVDFVKKVKRDHPGQEIILLTAFGNISDGVQAIKNGAFDYIAKGNDNDRILPLLHQATEHVLKQRKSAVRFRDQPHDFNAIIGNSAVITNCISIARRIADSNATVLILGETGTGKEVFAQAIHQNSRRKAFPIIAINCSAFSRDLLESELFGHKAGAFTGAQKDKKGLVELAEHGTLFLDEIGEMPIDLQAKLLRFLENGQYIKLGDTRISKADVRIIAATNRDPVEQVKAGQFREDLYYRLNVLSLILPALRERKADIAALASHFLDLFSSPDHPPRSLSADTLRLLENYPWKGNIRELRNVIERALILTDGPEILPGHLPIEMQQQLQLQDTSHSLSAVEKQHIVKILRHTGGNKTRAADLLGIGLTTLYRKMEEYQISK